MFWEKFGCFNFLCTLAHRSNTTKGSASVRGLMWVCTYLLQLTALWELLNSLLQHRILQCSWSCWSTYVPALLLLSGMWESMASPFSNYILGHNDCDQAYTGNRNFLPSTCSVLHIHRKQISQAWELNELESQHRRTWLSKKQLLGCLFYICDTC